MFIAFLSCLGCDCAFPVDGCEDITLPLVIELLVCLWKRWKVKKMSWVLFAEFS